MLADEFGEILDAHPVDAWCSLVPSDLPPGRFEVIGFQDLCKQVGMLTWTLFLCLLSSIATGYGASAGTTPADRLMRSVHRIGLALHDVETSGFIV